MTGPLQFVGGTASVAHGSVAIEATPYTLGASGVLGGLATAYGVDQIGLLPNS